MLTNMQTEEKEKIQIREGKTLKLSNVIIRNIPQNELINEEKIQLMINSYILGKGSAPIGPLITYSKVETDTEGTPPVTNLMFQLKHAIDVEAPYEFRNTVKVEKCLFARFNDTMNNVRFAYQKLALYAYENDLKFTGETYTIFVDNKDDKVQIDIFMPLA